jgi:tRNA threonylcarbamoyladenosine biosynthesis protein TsaE
MDSRISHSAEETLRIGELWGREAVPGWIIGLTGDLGAGKTQLVKGIARGLQFPGRVHSPTFNLVNEYPGGRLPLFHLDLYRLATPGDVFRAGLEDYLHNPPGVTVVEWVERWLGDAMNAAPLESNPVGRWRLARLETLGDEGRRIEYEDFGD